MKVVESSKWSKFGFEWKIYYNFYSLYIEWSKVISLFSQEYEKLSAFVLKNYQTELVKVEPSVKGWNWGQADFDGNVLTPCDLFAH